ncbi:MAG: hypothetical protein IKM43_04015 [Clostridia bacterium]|nr:hypothetical protein [Clostridia bacterium]
MTTIQELVPFCSACDELVCGKYILIDIKLNSILKLIENDEKLSNIIKSCLSKADFNSVFNKSLYQSGEKFAITVPTDENEVITLVYNLLYRFKSGEIDFTQFLHKFYSEDNAINLDNFGKDLIYPFKNAITNIYARRHILVNSDDYQDNYYNKIKTAIRLILSNIDNFKLKDNDKEEFKMLLNALYLSSDKNDKKMVYSIMIGLDYFSKYHKKTRNAYLSLEECFE